MVQKKAEDIYMYDDGCRSCIHVFNLEQTTSVRDTSGNGEGDES